MYSETLVLRVSPSKLIRHKNKPNKSTEANRAIDDEKNLFMNKTLITRLKSFSRNPFSRKIQSIELFYHKLKIRFFYKWFLKSCGKHSVVNTPLFWTPEYISIGNNVSIGPGCRIEAITRYGEHNYNPHIIIGDRVTFQQSCHITAASDLNIGADTTISFGVSIQDTDHEYQQINVNILRQPLLVKKTKIGDTCFIGSGAKIMAGTILGKQCIVGTNAVVRGIFPDYCVIVGIPAKIVKRFNPETQQWGKTNNNGEFINDK